MAVGQSFAIQHEEPFLSRGIPLQYCHLGDMLNSAFFPEAQWRHFPALHLLVTRKQVGSGQSDWMLLTRALSLEPGNKAKGTIRINLGQHIRIAVVSDILVRLFQRTTVWVGPCLLSIL